MSGSTAKAFRKAEEEKQKDFQTRREAMLKEMQALSFKYKIDLIPTLHYQQDALVPAITMVDLKDKYGQVTPEMQKIMEEKRKEDVAKQDDVIR